jgi:iron complex outermembrane receptor protein
MCCTSSSRVTSPVSFRSFNRWFATVLAAISLGLLAPIAGAQEAATGTIRGKALNASNGAWLANVTVAIDGTNRETLTNDYGEYEFSNVPEGEVTLTAKYIGQPELKNTVVVKAAQISTQDLTFRETSTTKRDKDGVIMLDPLVVSAERYRNAQAIALAAERHSTNIKNVVAIDQFGDIPSGNVGEFVKFMPGIQVDYGASNNNAQGYSDAAANGISVRGFGPEDTTVLIDGLPVASTIPGNLTRQVGLDQLNITNAAQVELIKVATPDMPNNSIGGQVNLITRSAFDYAQPTYTARVFFNVNSLATEFFEKTPGPVNKHTYKTTPGVEFSATYPFSSKFGMSFTGYAANEFSIGYQAQPQWNNNHALNYQNGAFTNSAGQPSSLANPVMTRYQITGGQRIIETRSGNLKFDWKPTASQVFRANIQYSTYESTEGSRKMDLRPTIANGIQWDSTTVVGSTANSTVAQQVITRDRIGDTVSGQIQYSYRHEGWTISAAASLSVAESDFEDASRGHFSEINLNLNPGRVTLSQINNGLVGALSTFTRSTNLPLDYTKIANWVFDGTTAKSGQSHNETEVGLYKVDIERDLSFIPFLGSNSLSFKTGFRHDEETQAKSGRGINYREILRPGASYTVADILDDSFLDQSAGFGLAPQQWASTYKLWELEQTKDIFYVPDFDEPTNTRYENYNSLIGQNKKIKESTDGWYAQLSGRFFKNRLSFVGGVRQETRTREGYSPFTDSKWDYIKRPDGSLYTDAANPNGVQFSQGNGSVINGVLITPPTNRPLYASGAAGDALRAALSAAGIAYPAVPYGPVGNVANASLASRMLQFPGARPVYIKRRGDPSYSLSGAFKVTEKIDFKAAWSRSFGLPKLEDAEFGLLSGTSNFSINDYTGTEEGSNGGFLGEIRLANPNIKPSTSDNWDFELSYYTDTGGKLAVSYYYKTVTNQPITLTTASGSAAFNAVLPAIGLNPEEYDNWRLVSSTNATNDQTTQGWEFEVRQDFGFLGGWGKNIQAFVSYSFTDLGEPPVLDPVTIQQPNGTTTTITPTGRFIVKRANKFGGAGLQYANRRFSLQVRGTYRNENEILPVVSSANSANIVHRFQPAETRVDINMTYILSKRYSLFASARDAFNGQRKEIARDDLGQLAPYATTHNLREFGTVWTVGINGKW